MTCKPRADKRIALSYLDESERNPTYFSWDAKDTTGRDYHITYRHQTLAVSGPDDFQVLREGVSSPGSTSARDQIIELTADIFDASLLRHGEACDCRFVNDPVLDLRYCINCESELRTCRLGSIRKAGTYIPAWLAEKAPLPYACWRAEDEEGGEVWIVWSATRLEIYAPTDGDASPAEPKIAYSFEWPCPDEQDIDARMMIEVELSGLYTFAGIETVG